MFGKDYTFPQPQPQSWGETLREKPQELRMDDSPEIDTQMKDLSKIISARWGPLLHRKDKRQVIGWRIQSSSAEMNKQRSIYGRHQMGYPLKKKDGSDGDGCAGSRENCRGPADDAGPHATISESLRVKGNSFLCYAIFSPESRKAIFENPQKSELSLPGPRCNRGIDEETPTGKIVNPSPSCAT